VLKRDVKLQPTNQRGENCQHGRPAAATVVTATECDDGQTVCQSVTRCPLETVQSVTRSNSIRFTPVYLPGRRQFVRCHQSQKITQSAHHAYIPEQPRHTFTHSHRDRMGRWPTIRCLLFITRANNNDNAHSADLSVVFLHRVRTATVHFSGPGTALGRVCVCHSVCGARRMTFVQNDLWLGMLVNLDLQVEFEGHDHRSKFTVTGFHGNDLQQTSWQLSSWINGLKWKWSYF